MCNILFFALAWAMISSELFDEDDQPCFVYTKRNGSSYSDSNCRCTIDHHVTSWNANRNETNEKAIRSTIYERIQTNRILAVFVCSLCKTLAKRLDFCSSSQFRSNDIQMSIFMWHNKWETISMMLMWNIFNESARLIRFSGCISWCDSWQWCISFNITEIKCIMSFVFHWHRASIIIAIDTIRKCLPFTSIRNERIYQNEIINGNFEVHQVQKKRSFRDGGLIVLAVQPTNESIKAIIESSWCQHLPHAIVSFWLWRGNQAIAIAYIKSGQSFIKSILHSFCGAASVPWQPCQLSFFQLASKPFQLLAWEKELTAQTFCWFQMIHRHTDSVFRTYAQNKHLQ